MQSSKEHCFWSYKENNKTGRLKIFEGADCYEDRIMWSKGRASKLLKDNIFEFKLIFF